MEPQKPGFTLMELILVIGVIGILSAVVITAINPLEQLQKARGQERVAEAKALQKAFMQSIIKNVTWSNVPVTISNAVDICQSTVTGSTCTSTHGGYDLSSLAPSYLAEIPVDSSQTGSIFTGYRLYRDGSYYFVCSVTEDPSCGP